MDFTGALTDKIGPLPGYAYVVIGVGGIFLVRKFKPSTRSFPLAAAPASVAQALPVAANANNQPLPSNDQWALLAAQHLNATTVLKPGDISTALSNYLAGSGLSGAQPLRERHTGRRPAGAGGVSRHAVRARRGVRAGPFAHGARA